MAIMIPESIINQEGVTSGEIRVFNLLREFLPDNYYVWSDPLIKNKYPDFVILGPDLGIIILEVKDWEIGSIIDADTEYFELRTMGRKPANPLKQAKIYMRALLDVLDDQPELKEKAGKYKGNPTFNYGHGVVFVNINSKEFRKKKFGNVIPAKFAMFKEDLDHVSKTKDDQYLLNKLKQMIPPEYIFTKLSHDKVEIIKSAVSRQGNTEGDVDEQYHTPKEDYDVQGSSSKDLKQNKPKSLKLSVFFGALAVIMLVGLIWAFSTTETNKEITDKKLAEINVPKDQAHIKDKEAQVKKKTGNGNTKVIEAVAVKKDVIKEKQLVKLPTNNSTVKSQVNSENREGIWIKGNINKKGEKIYHIPTEKFYSKTKPEVWFKTEDEAIEAGYRKAKDFWIKGNISKSGEKIYHMPGQKYYDKTQPEDWFRTEEEALAVGYRKSKI